MHRLREMHSRLPDRRDRRRRGPSGNAAAHARAQRRVVEGVSGHYRNPGRPAGCRGMEGEDGQTRALAAMSALAPFELTPANLYSREGLLRLDAHFLHWLGARDSHMAEQLVSART